MVFTKFSINSPKGFTIEDSVILMISLYSISFAVSFFVMPIIYHHIQYPYRDIEKFKINSILGGNTSEIDFLYASAWTWLIA